MKQEMIKVKIEEKLKEYPIIVGDDILKNIWEYISKYTNAKKFLVVTNPTVKSLYGKFMENENVYFAVIEDGEIYKNIRSYEKIINRACEVKLERNDAIIALGGGVVGDMAGFAAATYLRGIDFIQIPTTLLAMVDSSVGGKTGFNNLYGKHLIGAFYQPKLVLSDVSTLRTLDKTQFKSGLGEVLKYGFIEKSCNYNKDLNLASYLLENSDKVLKSDEEIITNIVKICCELKAAVVKADEKESNLRRILNFGHTIGHGIEKALDYKNITHGEAVILGMKIMFNYAVEAQLIDKIYQVNAFNLIDKLAADVKNPKVSIDKIKEAIFHDKKTVNNKIKYVVPVSRREVEVTDGINQNILDEEITKFFTN